jgi:hypothetical protein
MAENFTAKQREIVARKMGYDGPMQGFDMFLNSSPSLASKFNSVTDKYVAKMAKGGVVRKYAEGGVALNQLGGTVDKFGNPVAPSSSLIMDAGPQVIVYGPDGKQYNTPMAARAAGVTNYTMTQPQTGGVTGGGDVTYTPIGGKPIAGEPAAVTAALNPVTPEQIVRDSTAPETAATSTIAQAAPATAAVAAPTAPASTVTTTAAAPAIQTALAGVAPATGQMTPEAIVQAQQGAVSQGALATAAQGTATKVVAPADRVAQAGEMVSGSGVDMARAEEALARSRAETAQGVVTDEMTVQGQLNKLMTDFDAGKPPPWAAATMRSATAMLAARGLGASSLAGQAIVQAALEAATPIAAADAKVFEQMGLQNLSNRQQMAMLSAQQRAAFIGQEFDQTFQTKVLNAAKISDIANMNFTATQQIALENARLAQTMDLANLSNQQAAIMANAATVANMDLTNLSNRQQAAVLNAKSFLEMDMQNLQNEQQTTLFKAQQITTALLSDTAAENASKQFNASSVNQSNQFNANLATQVSQFNTAQQNALTQFNADQTNSIGKFNAEAQNLRDQFNSTQRLVIDQSNVQWRREISTANTAATNAANYVNAQNLQAMTLAEYNNATQLYRDQIEMAWSSYEKEADRAVEIIKSQITSSATTSAAKQASNDSLWTAIGSLALRWALK